MSLRGRLFGAAQAARVLAGGAVHGDGAVVFAYHDVREDAQPRNDYSVTPASLARHVDEASRWGLRFVSVDDVVTRFLSGASIDGLAAVVFDDALVGLHQHALGVLAERGVPATVFAVSAALGSAPTWWPSSRRTMTPDELTSLVAAGWSVGAHSRTHASLPTLCELELDDELGGGKSDLEALTGAPVTLLAYPFGHHGPAVREAARRAGYVAGFTFTNGRITPGCDRYQLPRLTMSERQTTARLAYHLARPASSWPDHQGPGPAADFSGTTVIPGAELT